MNKMYLIVRLTVDFTPTYLHIGKWALHQHVTVKDIDYHFRQSVSDAKTHRELSAAEDLCAEFLKQLPNEVFTIWPVYF